MKKQFIIVITFLLNISVFAQNCQKQIASTKLYRFELGYETFNEGYNNGFKPISIKVIDKLTNKKIQTLRVNAKEPSLDFVNIFDDIKEAISVVDCNFDGYKDIMVKSNQANVNFGFDVFLYQPTQKKFKYHEQLSQLCQTEIHSKSKEIHSFGNSGPFHFAETYTFRKGKMILTSKWTDACSMKSSSNICITTQGKLTNNKWNDESEVSISFADSLAINIYEKPDKASKIIFKTKSNSFKIVDENLKWIYVGYNINDSDLGKGWLLKEKCLGLTNLILQKKNTNIFNFYIAADAIIIKKSDNNETHQVLILENYPANENEETLEIGDFNKDKSIDIRYKIGGLPEEEPRYMTFYFDTKTQSFKPKL